MSYLKQHYETLGVAEGASRGDALYAYEMAMKELRDDPPTRPGGLRGESAKLTRAFLNIYLQDVTGLFEEELTSALPPIQANLTPNRQRSSDPEMGATESPAGNVPSETAPPPQARDVAGLAKLLGTRRSSPNPADEAIRVFEVEAHAAYCGDEVRLHWEVQRAHRLDFEGVKIDKTRKRPSKGETFAVAKVAEVCSEWHTIALLAYDAGGNVLDRAEVKLYNRAFENYEVRPTGTSDTSRRMGKYVYAAAALLLLIAQYAAFRQAPFQVGEWPNTWLAAVLFGTGGALAVLVWHRLRTLHRPPTAAFLMAVPYLNVVIALLVTRMSERPPEFGDRTRALDIGRGKLWNVGRGDR